MTNKVYDLIGDRIIKALDEGHVPWRKPWSVPAGTRPQNAISHRAYNGINAILLAYSGFQDPRWITYKKAVERGGQVRKGEKGTPVVFWKFLEKEDPDTGKIKTIPLLRYYTVFNLEQIENHGFPEFKVKEVQEFGPIEQAEEVVRNMPNAPTIDDDGADRAYYRPGNDSIHMPIRTAFPEPGEYYSTLFHELGHSTGHEKRLDRHGMETGIGPFGSPVYSKEELVAEFCAAFLTQSVGITNTLDNSTSYIRGWASAIRKDKKLVVQAASLGQKAADYILGPADHDETEEEPETKVEREAELVAV